MKEGILVRFKHETYCPQAAARGTKQVGEITALYNSDGIDYCSVLFDGEEYTWVRCSHLTDADDETLYDPLPPPEEKKGWMARFIAYMAGEK